LSNSTRENGSGQSSSTSPSTQTRSTSTDRPPILVRGERGPKTYPYKTLAGGLVPALAIRLVSLDGVPQPPALAVIDSGADRSTFPPDWARGLGIELEEGCCEKETAVTAGGETELWVYKPGVKALIDGLEHHLKATFCVGLEVALLGRKDFFADYKVTFDERLECFTLEPYKARSRSEGGRVRHKR
jgi:hypothetical protein